MAELHGYDQRATDALIDCLCTEVGRGNSFTDAAIAYYMESAVLCLKLHTDATPDELDQVGQDMAASFEKHTTRWRSKGHKLKGGIARVAFRRAPGRTRPRENGCMSCGSKRACRNHIITRDEAIAWGAKNCGGGKRHKTGPAVGGSLPMARRAAGLWDPAHQIDEGLRPGEPQPPHVADVPNRDYAPAWAATQGLDSAGPDGFSKARASEWGTAAALGYSPCQTPGAGLSCFDPASGLDRRWTVTGRHFTAAEKATFMKQQCTPTCDFVPVSKGAPADAKVGVRRVAPRNPAIKDRISCKRPVLPDPVPGVTLKPLPPVAPTPGATYTPPACKPDVVIGVDGGMFGSGWWRVIRNGNLLLVPNIETCGGPIPTF